MGFLTQTLTDPFASPALLAERRYGVIETCGGRLAAIHLRRWPKISSALEAEWWGRQRHEGRPGDRYLLYYDQPRWHSNYLALKYVVSERDCTYATSRRALQVLDEIARLKGSDAILCDVWNRRISDRLLARLGWEPLRPARWHRQYIKRFYGVYPPPHDLSALATAPC